MMAAQKPLRLGCQRLFPLSPLVNELREAAAEVAEEKSPPIVADVHEVFARRNWHKANRLSPDCLVAG
jgi:hypothetical protein